MQLRQVLVPSWYDTVNQPCSYQQGNPQQGGKCLAATELCLYWIWVIVPALLRLQLRGALDGSDASKGCSVHQLAGATTRHQRFRGRDVFQNLLDNHI